MSNDRVSATDRAEAGVSQTPTAARHPCVKCGRETKEHVPDANGDPQRICAMPLCRNVQSPEEVPQSVTN
jgi:hypothetical protein